MIQIYRQHLWLISNYVLIYCKKPQIILWSLDEFNIEIHKPIIVKFDMLGSGKNWHPTKNAVHLQFYYLI